MDRISPEVLAMNGDLSAEEYLRLSSFESTPIHRDKQTPFVRKRIAESMTKWHRKNRTEPPVR